MNYNKLIIGGNLCADPEVRESNKGNKVVNLRLACNGINDKEPTLFIDAESWDEKVIELSENYLKKGYPVLLDGRLKYNDKLEKVFLRVERGGLSFIGGGKKDGGEKDGGEKENKQPKQKELAAAKSAVEEDIPF
jgi:single-strand DNA-binding protein